MQHCDGASYTFRCPKWLDGPGRLRRLVPTPIPGGAALGSELNNEQLLLGTKEAVLLEEVLLPITLLTKTILWFLFPSS